MRGRWLSGWRFFLEESVNRMMTFFALGLVACADPELEQRIKDLEAKVADLEKRGPAAPGAAGGAAAPTATPEQEQAAAAVLKEATEAVDQMNFDLAREKVAEIKAKYADTRAAKAVQRLDDDLQVIGKPEAPLDVEKWYQGSANDVQGGKATMYVFWEVWCPHCKREVPKLSETYTKYGSKGLKVVGVTRQTKDIKDEQVTAFIEENKVNYPIAKDAGETLSKYYGVRGIPAAAVVKDGKVVWRGHPAKLNDELIAKWIGG
jgi:peroxiredoxin